MAKVRSCAIYRAIKALYNPIGRDKSRSYERDGLPILIVKNHRRAYLF